MVWVVGVDEGVGVLVGNGGGVAVEVAVGVGVGVDEGVGVSVGNGVGVAVEVAVGVGLGVDEGVGVLVGNGVGVAVEVAVSVAVGVDVGCGLSLQAFRATVMAMIPMTRIIRVRTSANKRAPPCNRESGIRTLQEHRGGEVDPVRANRPNARRLRPQGGFPPF